MPNDETIQRAFRLAYSLHPDRLLAVEIAEEALNYKRVLESDQDARPVAARPFKQRLGEENLLRKSVYLTSEKWEKDQESRAPKMRPAYRPTSEDLLYRYIKTLVTHSMDRKPVYAAVAVGSILYAYQPVDVAKISPDVFDDSNIRRVKAHLHKALQRRFGNLMLIVEGGGGSRIMRGPTDVQIDFVLKSLSALAPDAPCHPDDCLTCESLLDEYFFDEFKGTDADRIHLILRPDCGGWVRLVEEFNAGQDDDSEFLLADPSGRLHIPEFGGDFEGPGGGTLRHRGDDLYGGRFDPEPLNPIEIRSLRQGLDEADASPVFTPGRFVA